VASVPDVLPEIKELSLAAFPNPFRNSVTLSAGIPKSGKTEITIYNTKGQIVCKLCDEPLSKGNKTLSWDGKDRAGKSCAGGIYFCTIKNGDTCLSRKLVLIK
jgi:hypothetical protein